MVGLLRKHLELDQETSRAIFKRGGEMTVAELHKELSLLIEQGHADTRVIANISFKSPWDLKKGEEVGDFCLGYLNWVYYQSGDIEMQFSDKKE